MNLDEIREIVDFMKEVGLSELAYTEKNLSVKLKLAEQDCCCCDCDCDCNKSEDAEKKPTLTSEEVGEENTVAEEAQEGEFDPSAVIDSAEVRQAAAEAAAATAAEVKKAALRAAELVSAHLKDSAAMIKDGAEYIKAKRDERLGNAQAEPVDEEVEEETVVAETVDFDDDDFSETAPAAEPPVTDTQPEADESAKTLELDGEDAPVVETAEEAKEAVTLDTTSAKVAVFKTAETLFNTAKAGASLGKAGLKRGKGLLTSLFTDRYDPEPEEAEEAPVEVDTPTAETEEKVEEVK